MSDPSSGVPEETTDAEVHEAQEEERPADEVQLDLDEEKLDKWDEVKSDYAVEPASGPVPNSMAGVDLDEPSEDEGQGAEDTDQGAENTDEETGDDAQPS